MQKIMHSILFALFLTCSSAAAGTWTYDQTLQHGGITRYWDIYVPTGVSDPAPMVILLHGGTGSNKGSMGLNPMSTWKTRADLEGFILVLPNGTDAYTGLSGTDGSFNWNDCRKEAATAETKADDVGFISSLIDSIQGTYSLDSERVYVTGASNGGMMSYRLAQELSHKIAAIAAVIANKPDPSDGYEPGVNPVPVLIMNGTADTLMPWAGGLAGQGGNVISAEATRDAWIDFLNTDLTPDTHVDYPDIDATDNSTVSMDRYINGDNGTELEFYTVTGGGHNMPSIEYQMGALGESITGKQNNDVEGCELIWTFFSRFSLTPAGVNQPPVFSSETLAKPAAVPGISYTSQTLAGNAIDPESDALSFSKLSGPSWLTVNPDGTLSGTPGTGDIGLNQWTVRVYDDEFVDSAVLEIQVNTVTAQQPLNGYGSDGPYSVNLLGFCNSLKTDHHVYVFFPSGNLPAPAIFYTHGYGATDPFLYKDMIDHFVSRGFTVVYPQYPTLFSTLEERYDILWNGFVQAVSLHPDKIDTTRVGFMGHSFGGGATPRMTLNGVAQGWGTNGIFMVPMAPWMCLEMTDADLASIPASVKTQVIMFYDDDVNDHRLGIDIYRYLTGIPADEKDCLMLYSDSTGPSELNAEHNVPGSNGFADGLDFYGIWRHVDALAEYAFTGNSSAKDIALGNNSQAQRYMGEWISDSSPVLEAEITDRPSSTHPESFYVYGWSHSDNPRYYTWNDYPDFTGSPVSRPQAETDIPYSAASLLDDTADPDGDVLTFSKLTGPAWLTVDPDGSLSGIPADSDKGLNVWTIQVTDGELTDEAELEIEVSVPGGGSGSSGGCSFSETGGHSEAALLITILLLSIAVWGRIGQRSKAVLTHFGRSRP